MEDNNKLEGAQRVHIFAK